MINIKVKTSVKDNGTDNRSNTLVNDLDGEVTLQELLEWTKSSLVLFASEALKEEQGMGFDKDPRVLVDGKDSNNLNSVSPFGKIQFISRINIEELITATYVMLINKSKVDTGRYVNSHRVLFNGKQIATDMTSLNDWLATSPEIGANSKIVFINVEPYARKLERYGITASGQKGRVSHGKKTKKKDTTGAIFLMPNGTYFLTARAMQYKYGKNSKISFSFISGTSIGLNDKAENHHFKTSGRKKSKKAIGRAYLYPSITITVNGSGIL